MLRKSIAKTIIIYLVHLSDIDYLVLVLHQAIEPIYWGGGGEGRGSVYATTDSISNVILNRYCYDADDNTYNSTID